jgi:hypothetical protein
MSDTTLSLAALEDFYDALAQGIDRAGDAQAPVFLAKLALLLAQRIGDPVVLQQAVVAALAGLAEPADGEPPPQA